MVFFAQPALAGVVPPDAFSAGFIAGISQGLPLERCAQMGCAAGAAAVQVGVGVGGGAGLCSAIPVFIMFVWLRLQAQMDVHTDTCQKPHLETDKRLF